MTRFELSRRAVLALVAAALFGAPSPAKAQGLSEANRLAMLSRPAVVRILDGYTGKFFWPRDGKIYPVGQVASGSGFFLNPDGYIVTNAHVTNMTKQGEAFGRELLLQQFIITLAKAKNLDPQKVLQDEQMVQHIRQQAKLVEINSIHQVRTPNGGSFPFDIKSFGEANPGISKDVSIIKIEIRNAPTLKIGDDDRMNLLDRVVVIGYPGAGDTFEGGQLSKEAMLIPSVTDGSLSARKPGANGAPILQISAPATHGNSGGPVLNDRGEVIGLLTFRGDLVNGQEVVGFSFVVAARTVMEFVRQAGAVNQQGITDDLYRAALQSYWSGDYSRAITQFEQVKRLFEHHAETAPLIAQSQEALLRASTAIAVPVVHVAPAPMRKTANAKRAPAQKSLVKRAAQKGRVAHR